MHTEFHIDNLDYYPLSQLLPNWVQQNFLLVKTWAGPGVLMLAKCHEYIILERGENELRIADDSGVSSHFQSYILSIQEAPVLSVA